MSGFLLDTNCLSEIVRPQPERRVVNWIETTAEEFLYLSVLTLGEIRKGATLLAPSHRRTQLEEWLENDLPMRFKSRTLSITATIAERWGSMTSQARLKGITVPVIDGLLAATAAHHQLTIVTRNAKDFTMLGVPVLNPWKGA